VNGGRARPLSESDGERPLTAGLEILNVRKGLNEAAQSAQPGQDALLRYEHSRLRSLALRVAYPELELGISLLAPATP
jgi:hypothetical protein